MFKRNKRSVAVAHYQSPLKHNTRVPPSMPPPEEPGAPSAIDHHSKTFRDSTNTTVRNRTARTEGGWLAGPFSKDRVRVLADEDAVMPFKRAPDPIKDRFSAWGGTPPQASKRVPHVDHTGALVFSDDEESLAGSPARPSPKHHPRGVGRHAKDTTASSVATTWGTPSPPAPTRRENRPRGHIDQLQSVASPAAVVSPEVRRMPPFRTENVRRREFSRGDGAGADSSSATATNTATATAAAAEPDADTEELKRCTLIRKNKGKNKFTPKYLLYEESPTGGAPELVMMAKKHTTLASTTTYDVFDMRGADPKVDLKRSSSRFVGEFSSTSKKGALFVMTGLGVDPTSASRASEAALMAKAPEQVAVHFEVPSLMKKLRAHVGPRTATVLLPRFMAKDDDASKGHRTLVKSDTLVSRLSDARLEDPRLCNLATKMPSIINGVYQLNFGGRVKVASIKNFQLVYPTDLDHIRMQFGKVSAHKFILDFKSPFNTTQAFAVALAQFLA